MFVKAREHDSIEEYPLCNFSLRFLYPHVTNAFIKVAKGTHLRSFYHQVCHCLHWQIPTKGPNLLRSSSSSEDVLAPGLRYRVGCKLRPWSTDSYASRTIPTQSLFLPIKPGFGWQMIYGEKRTGDLGISALSKASIWNSFQVPSVRLCA